MKGLLAACLSLASLTLGAPSLRRQDGVTPQQLEDFKLYAQWSSAATCNNDKAANEPVTCFEDQCSIFASHDAKVATSFIGPLLDMRGFIGVDPVDKQIVVSFRGSVSVRNWIADFIFIQVPSDLCFGCLVHTGFAASWGEVSKEVLAGVKAAVAANPDYKVVVTGHSLGGAVATLAAAYIRKAGVAADLYTFGSPRVGNYLFARYVTKQAGSEYRITHTDDPVPRLPPIVLNYAHVSPEYWIDPGSDDVVSLNEVDVCDGYVNIKCNGHTLGLNMESHGWYFQQLEGCKSGEGTPFKRAEITDEELAAKLNAYVEMDIKASVDINIGLGP